MGCALHYIINSFKDVPIESKWFLYCYEGVWGRTQINTFNGFTFLIKYIYERFHKH